MVTMVKFRRLHLPCYAREQFLNVAVRVCPKLSEDIAIMIGRQVWAQSGDIRDVISISKLILQDDGHEEIGQIIRSLNK
ncbi:MAG: hypothetical protein WBZ36_13245, partial [Candidatus Nitrosopolaris sp.]